MTALKQLAVATTLLMCTAAAASPTVSELEAEQLAPTPESDNPGPLAFHVAVRARCGDPGHRLTVAAMLGDTLTSWRELDESRLEFSMAVSRRELVIESAALCRRRSDQIAAPALLPGAFAMQVFARCEAADGAAVQRTTSVPLAVHYACPEPAGTPESESSEAEAPAAP